MWCLRSMKVLDIEPYVMIDVYLKEVRSDFTPIIGIHSIFIFIQMFHKYVLTYISWSTGIRNPHVPA